MDDFEKMMCAAILHYLKLHVSFGADIYDVEYADKVIAVSYEGHTKEKDKIIVDVVEQLKKEIL